MPSTLLTSIRQTYPEFDPIPDEDLISRISEQNKNIGDAIRWEINRDTQMQLGRERIAAETPLEYDIADEQAMAPGLLGRLERVTGPGGRAIARGAGNMITSSIAAQDMVAAAPRVWLGDNPATRLFEQTVKPGIGTEVIRAAAEPIAERPYYGPQSFKEAREGGVADIAQFMTERGLEQVPQVVGSIAAGGAGAIAGLSPKAAALLGIGVTTFPQEAGGAYEEIKDLTGKESPGSAMAVGAVNTGLEMLGDAKMFERIMGGDEIIASTVKDYAKKAAARAAAQEGKEFATESAQEASTALIPHLTGQTPMPQDLGERMLEAGVSAVLPGTIGSVVTDTVRTGGHPYLTPPKLTPAQQSAAEQAQIMAKAEADRAALAAQINNARVLADDKRRQDGIDQRLATLMGEAREQAARERALAEQAGRLNEEENRIAVTQALAEADAVIWAAQAKREAGAIDIPELQPGIPVPVSPAMERIKAEQERRDAMTPAQRSALEMLERVLPEEPIPVNRLRRAPVPDTLSGLNDEQPGTMAPSPVDYAVAQLSPQLVPASDEFDAALKRGIPPKPSEPRLQAERRVPVTPAPEATPEVLPEEQASETGVSVRQKTGPRLAPSFSQQDLESGLSTAEQWLPGNPIVDFARATPPSQGQLEAGPRRASVTPDDAQSDLSTALDPDGRTPIDNLIYSARASRARSKKSALRREASRPFRVEAARSRLSGARQEGRMGTISNRFVGALEALTSRLTNEEIDKAVAGTSETDDGKALYKLLNARRDVDSYVADSGDEVNDNSRTYMERKYQENVLSVLADPNRTLPFDRAFSGKMVLKNALLNVRQNLAETGNIQGQSEEGIEVEGESGTTENPAIAKSSQAVAQETGSIEPVPAPHNARELIADFVDRETGSLEEEHAAWNLIAKAFGQLPPFQEPDPARTLAEQSTTLRAKVQAFLNDKVRKEAVRAHITNEERVSIGQQAVQAAVNDLTSSDRVKVIYDPAMLHEGRPVAGYLAEDGTIIINAAFIDSPQMAREVALEEMMHSVYGEEDVQASWDEVKAGVTEAERQAMIDAGYGEDVATEEAAIRKVISQLKAREMEGAVARFIRSVIDAVKRVFGVGGQDPYMAILKRALEGATPSGARYAIAGPDNPVAALDSQYMAAVEAGDMATADRLVGEAARLAGYTTLLHHGTTESTYTPGEWIGGDESAVPQLQEMADRFGIGSPMDVAGIMERWKAYGQLEELGATEQDVLKARALVNAARAGYKTKGSHALNFNEFKMPSGEQELGAHLGTVEQALHFGEYAHPFFVKLGRSIRTTDLGTWDYQAVMMDLRKNGVKISDSEYDAVFNAPDRNQALRDLLISKGVNSIVYDNKAEARGDSHIVMSPSQIKSADTITRDESGNVIPLSQRFNQASNDIRYSMRPRLTRKALAEAALGNGDWKDFYTRHQALLREVFGLDADLFQKLLSATSQATNVGGNVALALKAYIQLKTGVPFDNRKDPASRVKPPRPGFTRLWQGGFENASFTDSVQSAQESYDKVEGRKGAKIRYIDVKNEDLASLNGSESNGVTVYALPESLAESSKKVGPGYLPAVIGNLNRIRDSLDVQGQKISAYTKANEGDSSQVVVDRHIAGMLFGTKSPTKMQFAKASKILTEIAESIGWSPSEVQAALWAASIRKAGNTPQSYDTYIAKLRSSGTLQERIGGLVPEGARPAPEGSVGGSDSGQGSNTRPIRYSYADGYWRTSSEVESDLAEAGDPKAIAQAAASQASIIPDSVENAVKAIEARVKATSPKSKSAADRVALRIIAPVMKTKTLLQGALAKGLPSAWTIAAATGLASLVPRSRDIAAEAILKTDLHIRGLASKTSENIGPMIDRVAEAFSKLPTASQLEMEGALYMSMAKQLARDFRKNIDDRIKTAKNSADEALARELSLASRNITESFKGAGSAISSALRNISKEIPDSALVDAASARTWIESRVNNKSLPPIMSTIASDWLFGTVPGRRNSPIDWDPRLHERLQVMKEIADEKSALSQDIAAFDKAITGTGKKPSTESIMIRYLKFRDGHKDSMEKMRLIYKEMDKAEAEVNGSLTAQGILGQILSDPAYIARVEEAREHLGALSRGVKLPNGYGDNTSPFGFDTYLNPISGKKVVISQTPDPITEESNLTKLRELVSDVQKWMGTSEDPLLKSAWDREIQFLVNRGFTPNPSLQTGQNLFGVKLPSWWQFPLNPLSRVLTQNRLDVANNLWNRVGNRMALRPLMAAQVTDRVRKAFEQLAGGNDTSEARVKLAVIDAMKSHSKDHTDVTTVFQWWVPNVIEKIISQNQNPTQIPYNTDDWINGVQITKEDMAAVKAMKKWQTQANGIVQKGGKLDFLGAYIDPIGTEEIVAGRSLVRRSVDYGTKMARTLSEFGKTFTENYMTSDEAGKMALLDQHYGQMVLGFLQETDKDITKLIDKQDVEIFKRARDMDRSNTAPFTDLESFLDWWADEVASVSGKSTGEERIEVEKRLIGYFDGFTQAITTAAGQADKASVEDFEKKGIPTAIVKAVNGGANPFLTPRGRLIAPSSFYSYSMASDGDRGRFKSAAITALTLKEVVAAKNALEAIKKELEKYEGPEGLIAKEQEKALMRSRFLARRSVAAKSQEKARTKGVLVDYKSLVDHRQAVEVLIAGMERLALEHTISKEDNAIVSFSNNARSGLVSSVLASIKSIATNLAGGPIMSAMFKRMLGNYNFVIAPFEFIYEFSKAAAGSITKKLRSIKTIDKTVSAMARIPGFQQIIQAFIENQTLYEQNRAKAITAGLVDEPDWMEAATLRKHLKKTAGHLSETNDPGPFIGAVNAFSSLPVIRQLVELSKSTFPGAADRLMNTAFSVLATRWVNDIASPAFEAWKRRDTGAAGWDDLTSPLNVFSAEELGLRDNNILKSWRTILSPAGGIENLSLDYYKRTKGMTPAQRKATPLLSPEQMMGVMLEGAKLVNLPTASTTPLVAQGKGLSGTIRRWTALFLRYPIAAQGFLENISANAVGDSPHTSWKYGSGILALAIMLMVGAGASDFGQWMEEILYNNPRTKPSLAQTIEAGTALDYAKYAGIALTASYPYIAEQIGNALGGTSGRPLMDANRMIVPFGLANDAYQVISRTLQTGDAFYPTTDFMRRYVPLAGAALNRFQPGEVNARAAIRAARVAAPADMEVRQFGGSSSGTRETPMTPLVRRATNALLEGDEAGYNEAVERAVDYQVSTGKTPVAARRSVLATIASKDPARRVFGRPVTDEEDAILQSRMSNTSRKAYSRARSAFARFATGQRSTTSSRARRTNAIRGKRPTRRSALVR